MRVNILTLQARLKAVQLFLNHYFQNLDEWKHNYSTELIFNSEDWEIEIYDDSSIYERWTFADIEDYIDRHNLGDYSYVI